MKEDTEAFGLDPEVVDRMAKSYAKSGGGSSGGSNAAGTAGSMMLMSGNPYAMAAGAALKVVGSVSARRRAERQAKADAENQRRTKLMSAMGNLGSGIGSTGM